VPFWQLFRGFYLRMRNPGPNWLTPGLEMSLSPSRWPVRRLAVVAGDFLIEPGAGVGPVALGGGGGNAQSRGGLLDGQARKVAQLDQFSLDRVLARQLLQGFIQGEQVFDRFRRRQLHIVELFPRPTSPLFEAAFAPNLLDQDAAHRFGGRG